MGATAVGFDALIRDLESLPERAPKAIRQVMKRAGGNIKDDWKARWTAMPHRHIPHLVRSIAYQVTEKGNTFSLTVEPRPHALQARLASFIEFGTLTSGPHPGGKPALEKELPNLTHWLQKVTEDLLAEQK
jgi:HK97 gp10 family phage protein